MPAHAVTTAEPVLPDAEFGCDLCLRECSGFVSLEQRDTVPASWLAPLERDVQVAGGLHVTLDGVVLEDWWRQIGAAKGWDLGFLWNFGRLVIVGRYDGGKADPVAGLLEVIDGAFYAVDDLREVEVVRRQQGGITSLRTFSRDELPLVRPEERSREGFVIRLPADADPNVTWLPPH